MTRRRTIQLLVVAVVVLGCCVALSLASPRVDAPTAGAAAPRGMPAASPETKSGASQGAYSDLVRAGRDGSVKSVSYDPATAVARVAYVDGRVSDVALPPGDDTVLGDLAREGVDVTVEHDDGSGMAGIVTAAAPMLIVLVLIVAAMVFMQRRARAAAMGPQMALRTSARLAGPPAQRFCDVAGCDEAVEELAEVVSFFRDPERFARLGARLPSGIILHGDPGTGKTLLARALAGEAGLPFYATSGSDFVEKFVGVGASRVRELFGKARAHEEGAVIFIDEIDAVGRSRGSGDNNSERDQTLNQILVEMDGFSPNDRVVCVAATNRLDVLDPALLRPGRFGRQVAVPLPSAEGRAAILGVHAAGKPLHPEVDLDHLATRMGGLSGAELAEVVNEAAIMASRAQRDEIATEHLREGYLRVLAGPKRRSAPMAEGELEVIACHEAGHVLCAELGERYEKAHQVTIEPRGRAMGLAVYGQTDRALHDPDYLHEALVATLGGRAAEQTVYGRISSGAANDLQKATELARRAVEELGFSPRLGQIVAGRAPFSESTRALIDSEIERMVAEAYGDALEILAAHRAQLDALAARLLEQRELERIDILAAIGRLRGRLAASARPTPRPVPVLRPSGLPLAAAGPADADAA
jgi:cell division protease FtsH